MSDPAAPPPPPPSRGPQQVRRGHPTSGVLAFTFGLLGLTMLPLIGSILALVFGAQSRREARQSPDYYTDDLGRAGRILGWIGVALTVVLLVAALAAVALLLGVATA
jgi:hypothetical protein